MNVTPYTVELPFPPSMNRYWRSVGGRVLISKAGRAYRLNVAAAVVASGLSGAFAGELCVRVELRPPDRRRRDIDNCLKAMLDALQHAGVYADDNQIGELTVRRGRVTKPGSALVSVVALNATAD